MKITVYRLTNQREAKKYGEYFVTFTIEVNGREITKAISQKVNNVFDPNIFKNKQKLTEFHGYEDIESQIRSNQAEILFKKKKGTDENLSAYLLANKKEILEKETARFKEDKIFSTEVKKLEQKTNFINEELSNISNQYFDKEELSKELEDIILNEEIDNLSVEDNKEQANDDRRITIESLPHGNCLFGSIALSLVDLGLRGELDGDDDKSLERQNCILKLFSDADLIGKNTLWDGLKEFLKEYKNNEPKLKELQEKLSPGLRGIAVKEVAKGNFDYSDNSSFNIKETDREYLEKMAKEGEYATDLEFMALGRYFSFNAKFTSNPMQSKQMKLRKQLDELSGNVEAILSSGSGIDANKDLDQTQKIEKEIKELSEQIGAAEKPLEAMGKQSPDNPDIILRHYAGKGINHWNPDIPVNAAHDFFEPLIQDNIPVVRKAEENIINLEEYSNVEVKFDKNVQINSQQNINTENISAEIKGTNENIDLSEDLFSVEENEEIPPIVSKKRKWDYEKDEIKPFKKRKLNNQPQDRGDFAREMHEKQEKMIEKNGWKEEYEKIEPSRINLRQKKSGTLTSTSTIEQNQKKPEEKPKEQETIINESTGSKIPPPLPPINTKLSSIIQTSEGNKTEENNTQRSSVGSSTGRINFLDNKLVSGYEKSFNKYGFDLKEKDSSRRRFLLKDDKGSKQQKISIDVYPDKMTATIPKSDGEKGLSSEAKQILKEMVEAMIVAIEKYIIENNISPALQSKYRHVWVSDEDPKVVAHMQKCYKDSNNVNGIYKVEIRKPEGEKKVEEEKKQDTKSDKSKISPLPTNNTPSPLAVH